MAPANTLRVVELEFLASLKSRDPRVQRVLRDHLEITGLHGPWVPRGYKGDLQILLELKAEVAPRDH